MWPTAPRLAGLALHLALALAAPAEDPVAGAPDAVVLLQGRPENETHAKKAAKSWYYAQGIKDSSKKTKRTTFGPNVSARIDAPVDLSEVQRCFEPKVVVAAGLGRTGSTSLTLAAQIWVTLADPEYVPPKTEPWYGTPQFKARRKRLFIENGTHPNKLTAKSVPIRGLSDVIKIHNPVEWVMKAAGVVLTSHRKPLEQMASLYLHGGYDPLLNCVKNMAAQDRIYHEADVCCGGVAYDMPMEALRDRPIDVLRQIALAVGICRTSLTEEVLNYALKLFNENLPNNEAGGLMRQQQTWSTDAERDAIREKVQEDLESGQDPWCQAYVAHGGRWWPRSQERRPPYEDRMMMTTR